MKSKKIIVILSAFAIVIISLIGTGVVVAARDVQRLERDNEESGMEQTSNQMVKFDNYEIMTDVTEHELTTQDVPEGTSVDELDSYFFFGVNPGQNALSNVSYEIEDTKSMFEYAINWDPMGNYIRVGLISIDKSDVYYVTCIGGRAEGVIDISQIPAGDYYVMVYNETSSNLALNGAITYKFN